MLSTTFFIKKKIGYGESITNASTGGIIYYQLEYVFKIITNQGINSFKDNKKQKV